LNVVARLIAWSIVTFFFASGWMVTHAAQKNPPQTTEGKEAPSAPLAIPPSEIVPRGEQTLRALQEIRFQLAAETDVALNSIQKDISESAEKSDRRWQSVTEILSGLRSLPQLNDMLRQWSLEQSQLDSWDRALARRLQMLVDQEKEISQIYDSWRAKREQTTVPVALQKITIPLGSLKY
jgi:hypothetical protein